MKIGLYFDGCFHIDIMTLDDRVAQTCTVELKARDAGTQLKGTPEEVLAMLLDDIEISILKTLRLDIKKRRENAELEHARAELMETLVSHIRLMPNE